MPATTATHTNKRSRKRSRQQRRQRRQAQRRMVSARDLPSWKDLSGDSEQDASQKRMTWRFVVLVLLVATGLTLYIGHVKATQHLIVQLQQERNVNQQLMMQKEQLSGAYDRATGPAVIYERAPQLGLQESTGPTYQLERPANR